jgi:hypothetical protein
MKMNNSLHLSLVCVAGIICLVTTSAKAQAEWQRKGIRADWGGRDFACSESPVPKPELCNAATRGLVAVCWQDRKTGECGGAVAWCTYKKVTLDTRPDGYAPGDVYVCQ